MLGVTMWEIFSLGATPYHGCAPSELPSLLQHGHRLPKPGQCSEHTYAMARLCWQLNPVDRPTFDDLVELLARIAQDNLMTPEDVASDTVGWALSKQVWSCSPLCLHAGNVRGHCAGRGSAVAQSHAADDRRCGGGPLDGLHQAA